LWRINLLLHQAIAIRPPPPEKEKEGTTTTISSIRHPVTEPQNWNTQTGSQSRIVTKKAQCLLLWFTRAVAGDSESDISIACLCMMTTKKPKNPPATAAGAAKPTLDRPAASFQHASQHCNVEQQQQQPNGNSIRATAIF
jgi:hypothetical protein